MSMTKIADIDHELLEIYSRYVIEDNLPNMYFRQFVDYKLEYGVQPGETIRFTKLDDIPDTDGMLLDEDTPIPEDKMTGSEKFVTLQEFGRAITLSRRASVASIRPMMDDARRLLGRNYLKTMDTYLRNVFQSTSNKYYVDATSGFGANRAAVAGKFTDNVVATLVEKAKRMDWPKVQRGADSFYVFIGTAHQLRQISTQVGGRWEKARMYVDPKDMLTGEVGRLDGVVFLDSSQMQIYTGAGASGVNVHRGLFIGGGPCVGYGESVPLELIPKAPEDYGRKQGIAWYTIAGATILNNYLFDVETAEGI